MSCDETSEIEAVSTCFSPCILVNVMLAGESPSFPAFDSEDPSDLDNAWPSALAIPPPTAGMVLMASAAAAVTGTFDFMPCGAEGVVVNAWGHA